ncbi:bile acid:sodium symporter family protein [Halomarina pelagica]|uniref:bile acid:sodium symporter family protein n=1 Tax=Halomarina pelagica TaxID=2961599 RepID=UPI0020C1C27E|nr:bile acid:sodium symporter family protein [Halomarina sp. BND7]
MSLTGLLRRISRFASTYFVLWVLLFSGVAVLEPSPFTPVLRYIAPLLGVIMLGMGLTLQPADFRRLVERPRDVAVGALAQWLIMPAAAYGLYLALDLPPAVGVGLILVGAAPGGTASNVMAYLGDGDVALSVAITTVTTLAAPLVMPAWVVLLLGERLQVTFLDMFLSIVQIVLVPVLLGFAIRWLLDRFAPRAAEVGLDVFPAVSVAVIVAIVAGLVGANVETILAAGGLVVLAVVAHNAIGLGGGYAAGRVARMPTERVRTCAFEVGLQNSGLAAALAATFFGAEAALVPALFSVWHNVTGPALASLFTWHDEYRAGVGAARASGATDD